MTDTQQLPTNAPPAQVPPEIQVAPKIGAAPGSTPGEVVPSHVDVLQPLHADFAEFHEDYVRHYIALADTKATWTFALSAGLIVFLVGGDKFRQLVADPFNGLELPLFAATFVLLGTSTISSFLVIAPRFASPSRENVVFFGAVADRKDADEYVRDIASKDDNALTEARLKHCYDISRVCVRKYDHLWRAFWSGLLALIGVGLVFLLG